MIRTKLGHLVDLNTAGYDRVKGEVYFLKGKFEFFKRHFCAKKMAYIAIWENYVTNVKV